MKHKILMLVLAAMLMVVSAVPALAQRTAPCEWDWDRFLWRHYQYELWTCWSYDETEGWQADWFWTPDYGYWTFDDE